MIVHTSSGTGRRDALESVFVAHADAVYGFLLSRCASPEIAQDVTSEVFVEAAKRFATGRGDEVTIAWLTTVARRRLIDFWRSDSSQRRRIEQLRNVRGVNSTIDLELIELALASLPTRQRAALALRYLDEFSVTEIADALDTTYRSAESLLARARSNFAAAYEEELA